MNYVNQIEVSPNTAVYVCSTLTVMENFRADYTARAEATALGLSATEVFYQTKSNYLVYILSINEFLLLKF